MAPPKPKPREQNYDFVDADPEARDATLNLKIAETEAAADALPRPAGRADRASSAGASPALNTEIAAPRSRRGGDLRDPESGDAALTDQIARGQGADPASAELQGSAVSPVGVSPVDVVATPPSASGRASPDGARSCRARRR